MKRTNLILFAVGAIIGFSPLLIFHLTDRSAPPSCPRPKVLLTMAPANFKFWSDWTFRREFLTATVGLPRPVVVWLPAGLVSSDEAAANTHRHRHC